MRRLVKWVVILAVLGGLASIFLPGMSSWQPRRGVSYTTAVVSRGRVETIVNSTGMVKPVRTVSVGAFISGPIAEVKVDFNSKVKKGSVLATIDRRLLEAARDRDLAYLETQKADLVRAEALLKQAKNNEERARKLQAISTDYLSDTEKEQYETARLTTEAQRKLAKASIAQAEATLKNSETNLGYTEILAPEDGIIIERKVDPGQTVAASFQTPELFTIALEMDRHMHIFAAVDEADIGMITTAHERGQGVTFTVDAYPGELFQGTIFQIRRVPTTVQNVVTYPVVIQAANPGMKLLPGMTATISFQIESKDNVIRVPVAALRYVPLPAQVRPEDQHYLAALSAGPTGGQRSAGEKADQSRKRQSRVVWVQSGELLRAVPVTLGLMEHQYAELVAGDLQDGQVLVTGTEAGK